MYLALHGIELNKGRNEWIAIQDVKECAGGCFSSYLLYPSMQKQDLYV